MARRGWGYWTEAKLDILSAYLPAFATASKSVGSTTYLDLFAGHADNERRDTGADVKGSAMRALEVTPHLTDLYFCDLPAVASELETSLRAQFPNRDFTMVAGDSNVTIDSTLRQIQRAGKAWQPTFAFIDPYNIGSLHWSTLEKLASFKSPPRSKYKVELWILFMGSAIQRQLGLETVEQEQMVTRLFGSDEWRPIAASLRLFCCFRGWLVGDPRAHAVSFLGSELFKGLERRVTRRAHWQSISGSGVVGVVSGGDRGMGAGPG